LGVTLIATLTLIGFMKIAIIGATGYVGTSLVNSIVSDYPDTTLTLLGTNRTKLGLLRRHKCVEAVHVYKQGDSINGILRGSEACIDLSYQVTGVPSKQVRDATIHAMQLVHTCRQQGVQRLCIVGSIAVYGTSVVRHPWPEAPRPDRLPFPDTVYARLKAVVEKVAYREAIRENLPLALIRSGHIVGPGSALITNLCMSLLSGQPLLFEGRTAPSNGNTLQGFSAAIIKLAREGWGNGNLIANSVDLSEISYDQIVQCLAEFMGTRPLRVPPPRHKKRPLRDAIVKWMFEHRNLMLVLQSYFGIAEEYVQMKREHFKSERVVSSPESKQLPNDLLSRLLTLYDSDTVPHTRGSVLGPAIQSAGLKERLANIKQWICDAGFAIS
jgi:nucleoside-diphosphate-sugar epimerase